MLADLLLQDIDEEPEDGGEPRIHQGTKKDRIVSTTDPEMRHGRKSSTKTFNGYKASLATETEAGVIVAVDVQPANKPDGEGAAAWVGEANRRCKRQTKRVLGDTAYGSVDTRRELAEQGVEEVIAKAPPISTRAGVQFTLEDFEIDSKRGIAQCPAGKKSIRRNRVMKPSGWRYVFSRNDCHGCPIRAQCTTAKVSARIVTITEHTEELQRLRAFQRTEQFKKRYRRRVVVEHRIGRLVQLGIRQARYLGRVKVAYQVTLAAAVANLVLATSKGSDRFARVLHSLDTAVRLVTRCRIADLARIVDQPLDSRSIPLALLSRRGRPQLAPSRPVF